MTAEEQNRAEEAMRFTIRYDEDGRLIGPLNGLTLKNLKQRQLSHQDSGFGRENFSGWTLGQNNYLSYRKYRDPTRSFVFEYIYVERTD